MANAVTKREGDDGGHCHMIRQTVGRWENWRHGAPSIGGTSVNRGMSCWRVSDSATVGLTLTGNEGVKVRQNEFSCGRELDEFYIWFRKKAYSKYPFFLDQEGGTRT